MTGKTISHYQILEKLGEGGMGVVYKAQDTKLDRFVALKFLPAQLQSSDQDKARFVQEARAAAALSHPNVCSVLDIQEHSGQMFIVMEYVDGQTLRQKMAGLSLKQAVDIGVQVAEGLAAAHEKGIVHRDIKPENIMVRKDGIAQIMDFGLAKLRSTNSAITRLTKQGSTVGTAGYMSPEQVQGQDADHRSDIFSLGVLLFEMITGQLPFKGVHETAVAYEIVNVDAPPMSAVKPEVDPSLDAVVLECLEKDPKERAQSAGQVAVDLKRYRRESSRQRASRITASRPVPALASREPAATGGGAAGTESAASNAPGPVRRKWNPWLFVSLLLAAATGALGYLYVQSTATPPAVTRASLLPPESVSFDTEDGGHLAISPEGKTLAFVATDSLGRNQLWLRALNSLAALPLPGTAGAQYPFWSFDGKTIAFFADGKLKRVDATGGPVTTICDAPNGRGGSWNQAGTIVFAPASDSPIHRVAAAGGMSSAITALDTARKETSHRWPSFLPDGEHFVYTTQVSGGGSEGAILGGALGDSGRTEILALSSNAAFVNGHLTYVRQNNLIAHPFDPGTLAFTGDPVPIAERLVHSEPRSRSIFSSSRNGILVYQAGSSRPPVVCIVDRNGKVLSQLKSGEVSNWADFSPDGKLIALDNYDTASKNYDVWIYDIARSISTRFTFDAAAESVPVFSPDGATVMFSSDRGKSTDLYVKGVGGMSGEELLFGSTLEKYVTSWSPDGASVLLSTRGDPKTKWDVLLLPLTGEKKPVPLCQSEFSEWLGMFSPDGRWVAYQSDESGRYEVYVRSVDPRGGKWQVSSSGGDRPHWPRRSNEIIYVSADRKVMAAAVKHSPASFEIIRTAPLFELNTRGVGTFHAVSSDGQKFLVQYSGAEGESSPVTLVVNWQEELKGK
jgi:serine/threonine protein kinase